jgi:hypothetical protein
VLAHGAHHTSGSFQQALTLCIFPDETQNAAHVRFRRGDLGGRPRYLELFFQIDGAAQLLSGHRSRSMRSLEAHAKPVWVPSQERARRSPRSAPGNEDSLAPAQQPRRASSVVFG